MALTLDGNSGFFATVVAPAGKLINDLDAASNVNSEEFAEAFRAIQRAAEIRFIRAVEADTSLFGKLNIRSAWDEVIRQAISQSESIEEPTVGNSAGVSAETGDGVMRVSVINPTQYEIVETSTGYHHIRNETIEAVCVERDAPDRFGGVFVVTGNAALPPWDKSWPGGSGVRQRMRITHAQEDAVSHQPGMTMLVNGGMERFISNVPVGWTTKAGTAGTHFGLQATPYIGTNSLFLTGDGSTLAGVTQTLRSRDSGSPVELRPYTYYRIECFARRASGAITGNIRVAVNGTSGTLNIDCSALTTSWARHETTFHTVGAPSSSQSVDVYQSTAMGSGHTAYIDEITITPMYQLTPSGPWAAITTGATPFAIGDRVTRLVTNDYSNSLMLLCDRLFDLHGAGQQMPQHISSTNTIADSFSVTIP